MIRPKSWFSDKEAEDEITAVFGWDMWSLLDWEWKRECHTIDDALQNELFIKWASHGFSRLAKKMTIEKDAVLDDDLLNPENWKRILLALKKWPLWEGNDLIYIRSKAESLTKFFDLLIQTKKPLFWDNRHLKKDFYGNEADRYMKLLWKIAWGKIVHEGGLFRNDKGEVDARSLLWAMKDLVRNKLKEPY